MSCEMPSVYGHKLRRARKPHKCYECGGEILVGESYHYHHGVWNSEGASFKVCLDCEALRAELNENLHNEDRVGFGQIKYDVCEYGHPLADKFNAIVAKRRIVREELEKMK